MRLRRITRTVALLTCALAAFALTASHGAVGAAHAGDEIDNSVAGVIDGDGPEVSGDIPPTAAPRKHKNRHNKSSAAAPIWEQDGPPINRGGVNGY